MSNNTDLNLNLDKWEYASNYAGTDYSEYYVIATRTRDSYILQESNFVVAFDLLGGIELDNRIEISRSGHWACGWVEQLLVHSKYTKGVRIAQKIQEKLNNDGILDHEDYSEREQELIRSDFEYYKDQWAIELDRFLGFGTKYYIGEFDPILLILQKEAVCNNGAEDYDISTRNISKLIRARLYDIAELASENNNSVAIAILNTSGICSSSSK